MSDRTVLEHSGVAAGLWREQGCDLRHRFDQTRRRTSVLASVLTESAREARGRPRKPRVQVHHAHDHAGAILFGLAEPVPSRPGGVL
ncbi:hypothetical protein HII36_22110 [Nonomuraea sp. NN258]|uniref:hypothetical protein n=1 Tax=Nonomuraea antri TaxID=2730852 RepID=UPI0015687969|nr:hypothetical protein [Nonomuraea antri]NRQ34522.1 hypothetical protein [Nonomuraea antri]